MPPPDSARAICFAAAIAIVPLVAAQWLLPPMPLLTRQILLSAWGVGAIVFFQRWYFSRDLRTGLTDIGIAGTPPRAIAIGVLAAVPMWVVLPVLCRMNAIPIAVRPDWPSVLLGVMLVNGIAEEVIHRGFVFHRFRRDYSFARAAAIGASVFAAQHLYLIATVGLAGGVSAIALAALLTWPLAYAFERGGNSIVVPAILHTSSNAPMLIVESPDGALASVLVPYMAAVLGSICLVFPLGRLLSAPDPSR